MVKLAGADATLADLQAKLEAVRGVDRDSLDGIMLAFEKSAKFAKLKPRTQADYKAYRAAISKFKTRAGKLGTLTAARLASTLFQGIVDKLEAAGTPTKANHWLSYLRRVYNWAIGRMPAIRINPLTGVDAAQERKRRRLPSDVVFARVLAFARERGQRKPHTAGSVASYLYPLAVLAYACRLRSVECITLTDDHALPEGILTNRRKGSRDNIAAWNDQLRSVWREAQERRAKVWGARHMPVPLNSAARRLLVNVRGEEISDHAVQASWAAMMRLAVKEGIIGESEKFGTHDCKRKGVTDAKGNRHDKQQQSGHRSERMMDVYDLEVPVVPATEPRSVTRNGPPEC